MRNPNAGVTLLELMFAIAILAILTALAAPSYRDYTREARAVTAQNDLVTALSLARSEAGRRSVPVSVCASTDGATCSDANNWAQGWISFTDATGDAGTLDGTDALLQVWNGYPGDLTLTGNDALSAVRYLPNGMVDSAAALGLTLRMNGCQGSQKRNISIALPGFVSSAKAAC